MAEEQRKMVKMQECESRRYDADIRIENEKEEKRVCFTINLLNVEKKESGQIIDLAETFREDIKAILTR